MLVSHEKSVELGDFTCRRSASLSTLLFRAGAAGAGATTEPAAAKSSSALLIMSIATGSLATLAVSNFDNVIQTIMIVA
jgi:hypothetical protein